MDKVVGTIISMMALVAIGAIYVGMFGLVLMGLNYLFS